MGVACQSNKTASSDPYNQAQSYGGAGDYANTGTTADPYATSGEYDNVYSSGGGQAYGNASTYQGGASTGGGYGSDDYYSQDNTPAYTPPAPSYSPPTTSTGYNSGGGAASNSSSHTVSKGDTLYNISKRYGTSVSAIQRANGINGDLIRLGETLVIP
jgi:LysM repeat protein